MHQLMTDCNMKDFMQYSLCLDVIWSISCTRIVFGGIKGDLNFFSLQPRPWCPDLGFYWWEFFPLPFGTMWYNGEQIVPAFCMVLGSLWMTLCSQVVFFIVTMYLLVIYLFLFIVVFVISLRWKWKKATNKHSMSRNRPGYAPLKMPFLIGGFEKYHSKG